MSQTCLPERACVPIRRKTLLVTRFLTSATIALASQVQQQVLQDGGQVLIVEQLLISPLAECLTGVVPKQHL